jgi:hypothetical protein
MKEMFKKNERINPSLILKELHALQKFKTELSEKNFREYKDIALIVFNTLIKCKIIDYLNKS